MINNKIKILSKALFIPLVLFFACHDSNHKVEDFAILDSEFIWRPDKTPMISAHRGGPSPGFPENCLETFQHTIDHVPAMIECDINISSDGELVLMHDDKIDRTTNGSGFVDELRLENIKSFTLVDGDGNDTSFKVPTLKEALLWAKGKAILSLDVKRGVPFKKVIELVEKYNAEAYVTIIVYTAKSAKEVFKLNPELKLSATIRNKDEYNRLNNAGIPDSNLIAFTGLRRLPKTHYEMLHNKGILCILGAIGNLDRRAERRGDDLYVQLVNSGVDIIATDRPKAVARALKLIK